MKSIGRIGDYKVLTMIDSGASHCFITDQVVQQLGLLVDPSPAFSVVLGNGQQISTRGQCRALPIFMYSHTFSIDCYLFLLGREDLILGVS